MGAHRDIKLENLLLSADFEPEKLKGSVQLADFGFAKLAYLKNNKPALKTPCYTPMYVTPEVLNNQKYDHSCDIWALGVLLYILITNKAPFGVDDLRKCPEMNRKIREGNLDTSLPQFEFVSSEIVQL